MGGTLVRNKPKTRCGSALLRRNWPADAAQLNSDQQEALAEAPAVFWRQ